MSFVVDLGIHTPSALPYLIAARLLPENPSKDSCRWATYNDAGYEEEICITETSVVWSQCGQVIKVFTFDKEEGRLQAHLTWFPTQDYVTNGLEGQSKLDGGDTPSLNQQWQGDTTQPHAASPNTRGLVVLLKSQAHIFFLDGPCHVVNLPLEVDRAFPAPVGLILQRKISVPPKVPPTPLLPAAPHNTFLSSQYHAQKTTQHRYSVPYDGGSGAYSAPIFADWFTGSKPQVTEEIPRLYAFTDPSSEIGLVVISPPEPRRDSSVTSKRKFRAKPRIISEAEHLLFFSSCNEDSNASREQFGPLYLALTVNSVDNHCTVWEASYDVSLPQCDAKASHREIHTPARRRSMRSSFGGPPGTQTSAARVKGRLSTASNLSRLSLDRASIQEVLEESLFEDPYLRESTNDLRGSALHPSVSHFQARLTFAELGRFQASSSRNYRITTFLKANHVLMYILDRSTCEYISVRIPVCPRDPSLGARVAEISYHGGSACDIVKLADGNISRLVLLKQHSDGHLTLCIQSESSSGEVRLPLIASWADRGGLMKNVDSQEAWPPWSLCHPGTKGTVDLVDDHDVHHRVQLLLCPRNEDILQALDFCQCILRDCLCLSVDLISCWWISSQVCSGRTDSEWSAFIVTILSIALADLLNGLSSIEKAELRPLRLLSSSASGARSREGNDGWSWTRNGHPQGSKSFPPSQASEATMKDYAEIARQILVSEFSCHFRSDQPRSVHGIVPVLLLSLHVLREERKLNVLAPESSAVDALDLMPILVQLGVWLRWDSWSYGEETYYSLDHPAVQSLEIISTLSPTRDLPRQPFEPPSIFMWVERCSKSQSKKPYFDFGTLLKHPPSSPGTASTADEQTPIVMLFTQRLQALTKIWCSSTTFYTDSATVVAKMTAQNVDNATLETFPNRVAAPLRRLIAPCHADPPSGWNMHLLKLLDREDLNEMFDSQQPSIRGRSRSALANNVCPLRDLHSICTSAVEIDASSKEKYYRFKDPHKTLFIFEKDQRYREVVKLLDPAAVSVNVLRNYDEDNSEAVMLSFEEQIAREAVAIRTMALPAGNAALSLRRRIPMVTEKLVLPGFSMKCNFKPSNRTVTADRSLFTDEKISWAFFHAGVSAGLKISPSASGVDTSWIAFNKPTELNNRHAGLLLGLGLNGHLKGVAKWLVYKYLTPKHTMTSVGLLLGLSVSAMGTMDTLITRLLSVHVTCLLPPGAAELNLSPLAQTVGLMGIGLLYYNTQHRRMSEVMLSEIENNDVEDSDNSGITSNIRDECYRLAAGFALGFINLGKGNDLRGLHDMHLTERLLSVAVGSREVSKVHILDQATAAAVVAIACVFMKTHDEALARKIDIPDAIMQFDYVRPDVLLLRTVARHLIMWDHIKPSFGWIKRNLPATYREEYFFDRISGLHTEDIPFYNILIGLCWVISLRYAGTGSVAVRDVLLFYLDRFCVISRDSAMTYDERLTHSVIIRGVDLLSLACATVMAGTGDLPVFRRLRWLHSRIILDINYGGWFATHLAMGVLFMGGGLYTFNTSNLAIASLLCAFYPLFPTDVLDNKAHCQAFRHFWVFGAEARRLTVVDVDTLRPIKLSITVVLLDGTHLSKTAPCLLPELGTIRTIRTASNKYWTVTLDFVSNPAHLEAFKVNQTLYVKQCPPSQAHKTVFGAEAELLDEARKEEEIDERKAFDWLWDLDELKEKGVGREEVEGLLDGDPWAAADVDGRLAAGAEVAMEAEREDLHMDL